jgi:hypothetical protein
VSTTKTLSVFDPPMCCSSGLCGPDVDPALVRFSDDLFWLARHGVRVTRHNLAQEPGAFVGHPVVLEALQQHGEASLPLVLRGDDVMSRGAYPSRETMAGWFALDTLPATVELSMAADAHGPGA